MSKKPPTSTRTIIDEDNLYEILYHMLWHKDMFQPSANLPIFIPDTVLFRPGMPVAWYFSDSEGVMKRKLEANLTIPNIMETFLKKKSKYGIVAYYIYLSDTIKEDNNDPEQSDQTIIEYYDEPAFKKLLSNPHQLKKGILQRFIDPQGDRNSLIQCIWTKRICMFNRRTNFRLLKDNNANIYEKFVTFEGPPHMSEASALKGTALPVKLKQALDFIVGHISTATFERYQVSKFVCYLKVDDQNRIWYLYSGFFRVSRKVLDAALKVSEAMRQETDPIELNENLRIPSNINVGQKSGARTSKVPESLATCPRCSHVYSSSNFVEVNYKMILEAAEKPGDIKSAIEEFDHTPEIGVLLAPKDKGEGGEEDGTKLYRVRTKQTSIPYIIRKVHTRMKAHEFEELRDEDYFNNKKARVCYNCYFYISKTNNFGGNDLNPYHVRDKALHPRPIGQTLDVNKRNKEADKTRTTVSGKINLSRAHSMASLDTAEQRAFSASKIKRSTSKQRQTANQENSWMDSNGRAISRGKEETLWGGTSATRSQILEGDEHKRGFRSTVGSEVQKYEQELEEMIQENIFKKHQSGQILNLGGFEKRKRSYENIGAALPTTLSFGRATEMMSRATSMSHQTDGLYNHMKGQDNRSKVEHEYHDMTYDHDKIAEYQEEYLQEISENRPQSKMSGPRYRIPNISTNRRESTRAGLGSQTERISLTGGGNFSSLLQDRSSHRDIINQKSLNMNKVNGFNAQRSQSTQRGYAEHAGDTVKAYFGKQADRLLAKRSTSLVRFLKNGPRVPIHKSKDFTTRNNYDYKKPEKIVLRELQTSHMRGLEAELEGDWYIVPPKITKEDRSYSNPAFIASKTERTKSGLLTNEGDSINFKTFERTNHSQFPHMKDQGKLLSAYNPMAIHNLSKSNEQALANSNEVIGATSDLFEYSNTLPLKSSMMLKETTEGNNPKETIITVVEDEAKKELKTLSKNTEQETASKEPYLRTLTQQEFQKLTAEGGQRRGESQASSILSRIGSEILVSQKEVKSESRSRKEESYPQTMIEYESDLINESIANRTDKASESREMISYDITNSRTVIATKMESRKSEVQEDMSDSRDPSSESSEFDDDEEKPQESEQIRTETEVETEAVKEKNKQEGNSKKAESDYEYDYEELEDISEAISEALYRG